MNEPTIISLSLRLYPRLAINLDKVLYARSMGATGSIFIKFENGEELLLGPEEVRNSCFAPLIEDIPNFPDRTAIGHKG